MNKLKKRRTKKVGGSPDSVNGTQLYLHVKNGNIDEITKLLNRDDIKKFINYNGNEDGNTPLHIAVQNGNAEIVNLLINHGADIETANNKGALPFELKDNDQNNEWMKSVIKNTKIVLKYLVINKETNNYKVLYKGYQILLEIGYNTIKIGGADNCITLEYNKEQSALYISNYYYYDKTDKCTEIKKVGHENMFNLIHHLAFELGCYNITLIDAASKVDTFCDWDLGILQKLLKGKSFYEKYNFKYNDSDLEICNNNKSKIYPEFLKDAYIKEWIEFYNITDQTTIQEVVTLLNKECRYKDCISEDCGPEEEHFPGFTKELYKYIRDELLKFCQLFRFVFMERPVEGQKALCSIDIDKKEIAFIDT